MNFDRSDFASVAGLRGEILVPVSPVNDNKSQACMLFGQPIDLFHNGGPIKYSFVLMPISLSSLAAMRKIQKNMLTKMRPVGAIDINTIEYQIGRHL